MCVCVRQTASVEEYTAPNQNNMSDIVVMLWFGCHDYTGFNTAMAPASVEVTRTPSDVIITQRWWCAQENMWGPVVVASTVLVNVILSIHPGYNLAVSNHAGSIGFIFVPILRFQWIWHQ